METPNFTCGYFSLCWGWNSGPYSRWASTLPLGNNTIPLLTLGPNTEQGTQPSTCVQSECPYEWMDQPTTVIAKCQRIETSLLFSWGKEDQEKATVSITDNGLNWLNSPTIPPIWGIVIIYILQKITSLSHLKGFYLLKFGRDNSIFIQLLTFSFS